MPEHAVPVAGAIPRQGTFDELGTSLAELTFVVVDLETTGGSPASVGDHRDRRGQGPRRRGARRVPDPGQPGRQTSRRSSPCSPASPTRWSPTRRRSRRAAGVPRVGARLACWSPTTRRSTSGFLRAGCARLGLDWPSFDSVDTARLARRVLTRDEAPDCKLATLVAAVPYDDHAVPPRARRRPGDRRRAARPVRAAGQPRRAHLRGAGVVHRARDRRPAPQALPRRRPAGRAGRLHLPRLRGRPLYIGRSRHVRARVRQYFVASEPRTRMAEMVGIAERVDAIACAHPLEAEVRELRLIAEHKPRYNRRSRFPERAQLAEADRASPIPRLSVGTPGRRRRRDLPRPVRVGAGRPGRDGRAARGGAAAPVHPADHRRARPDAGVRAGRDGSMRGAVRGRGLSRGDYAPTAEAARAADVARCPARCSRPPGVGWRVLGAQERYEEAAAHRDRATAFVRTAARMQRLAALAACRRAGRRPDRASPAAGTSRVVRHGRLAGASRRRRPAPRRGRTSTRWSPPPRS